MLSQEKMWDLPLDAHCGKPHINHGVIRIAWACFTLIGKLCFRVKVKGIEHIRSLKGTSGGLIVANHESYLDPVFFIIALGPSQFIRYMARENLFTKKRGLSGQFISRCGAFPVKRDAADRQALKRAATMLKRREIVGIFPEGTRRGKSDRLPKLHAGSAFVARLGKAPLIPACGRNISAIKEKGSRMRFVPVSIEFGAPIEVSEFDFLPKEERLDAATWFVMREVYALRDCITPEEVDMRTLFPHDKDYTEVFACHVINRLTPNSPTGELAVED